MRKLTCKNQVPHLLTIMVTLNKTKQPQNIQHANDRHQTSVCKKNKSLHQPIFSIGQYNNVNKNII